ncbi:hypothetical protein MKX03_012563 [Papaver bracteatum]|nr:hypothetical protein MKX03_012563 [Papaver bracteatum]
MVNLRRFNCPEGTVPIRRINKEELIRVKSFMESFERSHIAHPNAPVVEPPGQHVAVYHSPNGTDPLEKHIFHGIKANLTVENLSLHPSQMSASLLWLESGPAGNASTIQAGWMVSPTLFGDSKTHIFVSWWGAQGSGCWNILCLGFVQTHKDYYVGQIIEPTSQYDGQHYYIGAYIHQDGGTGDWWFSLYGHVDADIGYWPREVVSSLGTGATYMAWGGLVRNIPHEASPPMGNGHFPGDDSKKVAVISNMYYLDEKYNLSQPGPYINFRRRIDRLNCYALTRNDYDDKVGYSIFFGGPGGNCD